MFRYHSMAVAASVLGAVALIGAGKEHAGGGKAAGKKVDPETNHGVDEKHKNPALSTHSEAPRKDIPDGTASSAETSEKADKERKSIVPSKYAGKYRGGHAEGDKLGALINEHSQGTYKDGDVEKKEFSFDKFFDLMEKNGVDKAHVTPFREAVKGNAQGARGRARMTLRNRVETLVRSKGHFIDYEGNKHEVAVPPRPVTPRPPKAEPAKEPAAA